MRKLLALALIVAACAFLWQSLKPKQPASSLVANVSSTLEVTPPDTIPPALAELDIEQAAQIRIPNQIIATVEAELIAQEPTPDETAYMIVPESKIDWLGRRVGGEHKGTLTIQEGRVNIHDGQITDGQVVFDMDSIRVSGPAQGLEEYLKSADFFDIYTYPRTTFMITKIAGNNITGILTIKDVSKAITFPGVIITDEKDVIVDAEFALNRKERNVMGG